MIKRVLSIIPWIISICMGAIGMILMKVQGWGIIKSFLYGIGFCLITNVINFIIVKILGKEKFLVTLGISRVPMIAYFITNILTLVVISIATQNGIFNIILVIILGILLFDFVPLCITFANLTGEPLPDASYSSIMSTNSTNNSYETNISDIKYSQKDNFGNTVYKNSDGTVNDEVAFSKKGNFGETIYYRKDGTIKGTSRKDNFGNEQYTKK